MKKAAKEATKSKSLKKSIDEPPIEEWEYLEKLVEHAFEQADERLQSSGQKKNDENDAAPEKKQVITPVQRRIILEYGPREFYAKQEWIDENKGKQKGGSTNKELILEWEQGLKDEDALYKDPIMKVQDFARDFTNSGKRFLDRRAQKYKPS
ncbi:hypothetical protein HY497_01460 [Candidatus Woesearchaeota archaeon]|nr:hypothetical protein [Candidatus Woesearchaeota archaeon]